MGTPNFARPKNASKYFVVLTNREEKLKVCNDCGENHYEWEYDLEDLTACEECGCTELNEETQNCVPDEHECDDLQENLFYKLKEELGATKDDTSFNDRNYNRSAIAAITENKSFGEYDINIEVKVVLQSAYYEGATLDYLVYIEGNNGTDEVENDEDDILEDIFETDETQAYYTDLNKGMRIILCNHAKNWYSEQIERISTKLEEIFEEYSEHKLNCKGIFSNGEAIYEKA